MADLADISAVTTGGAAPPPGARARTLPLSRRTAPPGRHRGRTTRSDAPAAVRRASHLMVSAESGFDGGQALLDPLKELPVVGKFAITLCPFPRGLLILLDRHEVRSDDRDQEREKSYTDDNHHAADETTPACVGHNVPVADRRKGHYRPPHRRAVIREVLVVDEPHQKSSEKPQARRRYNEVRKDPLVRDRPANEAFDVRTGTTGRLRFHLRQSRKLFGRPGATRRTIAGSTLPSRISSASAALTCLLARDEDRPLSSR